MLTRNNTGNTSEEELQIRSKDNNNNIIYIAIVIVILATLIAMTGVYYEYW